MSEENNKDLHQHTTLRNARLDFILNEKINAHKTRLKQECESYGMALEEDKPRGVSPLLLLKIEALAAMATFADYHCMVAHRAIEADDHNAAHAWAVDEGRIHGAIEVIASVEVDIG